MSWMKGVKGNAGTKAGPPKYKTGGFVKGFVPFAKKDGTEEVSKAAKAPAPKGLPDDKAPGKAPPFGKAKSCGGSASSGARRREMAQKNHEPI